MAEPVVVNVDDPEVDEYGERIPDPYAESAEWEAWYQRRQERIAAREPAPGDPVFDESGAIVGRHPERAHLPGKHDQKTHAHGGGSGSLQHGDYTVTPSDPMEAYAGWGYYQTCTAQRAAAEALLGHAPRPTIYDEDMDPGLADTLDRIGSGRKRLDRVDIEAQEAFDDAAGMLRAIRDDKAPWDGDAMPLHRGMVAQDPIVGASWHERIQPGDPFDISLGGFSPDRTFAQGFQWGDSDHNVMLRASGPVRGLRGSVTMEVQDRNGRWTEVPTEVVTSGRFVVTGKSRAADGSTIIDVRQEGVFDPDRGGEFVRTAAAGGGPYRRPEFDWLFGWPVGWPGPSADDATRAHLSGKHDQKSHAHGGGQGDTGTDGEGESKQIKAARSRLSAREEAASEFATRQPGEQPNDYLLRMHGFSDDPPDFRDPANPYRNVLDANPTVGRAIGDVWSSPWKGGLTVEQDIAAFSPQGITARMSRGGGGKPPAFGDGRQSVGLARARAAILDEMETSGVASRATQTHRMQVGDLLQGDQIAVQGRPQTVRYVEPPQSRSNQATVLTTAGSVLQATPDTALSVTREYPVPVGATGATLAHLPGKHDQKAHAHGGGAGMVPGTAAEMTDTLFDAYRADFMRRLDRGDVGPSSMSDLERRAYMEDDPDAVAEVKGMLRNVAARAEVDKVDPDQLASVSEASAAVMSNPAIRSIVGRMGAEPAVLAVHADPWDPAPGDRFDLPQGRSQSFGNTVIVTDVNMDWKQGPLPVSGPLQPGGATVRGANATGVIVHELGHQADAQANSPFAPGGAKPDWGATVARSNPKSVSYYAQDNDREAFAETFAAVLAPGYSRAAFPADAEPMLAWMEDFVGVENVGKGP